MTKFEEICEIKNIESNEYPDILCRMTINNKEIICVGNNNGISIIDFENKKFICNVNLSYITTSLISFKNSNNNYLIIGAKSSNRSKTKFNFYFLNLLLNYNKNGEIKSDIVCTFDPMHFYDINSLKLLNNENKNILISSGNEDKTIKIWH